MMIQCASRYTIKSLPEGRKLCKLYQNFDEEGFPRSQLRPLCRGLGVAVFFGSFSSAVRRNEQDPFGSFRKEQLPEALDSFVIGV